MSASTTTSAAPVADPGSPSEDDLRSHVGANVRRLRESLSLAPSELARLTGVDRARIYKIESSQISPGAALLLRLARALGVSAEELAKERKVKSRK